MKNTIKLTVAVIAAAIILTALNKISAPETRMGYANVRSLVQKLPEFKDAFAEIDSTGKMYQQELVARSEEYNKKLDDLMKKTKDMDTLIRSQREKELEQMRVLIQEFKNKTDQSMREREIQLLKPLFDRAKQAVEKVAQQNGYTHVINEDASTQMLIYAVPATKLDSLVWLELNRRD